MNYDLKKIKKYYGEQMMHLCRELFPTILDEEGTLSRIMLDHFAPSRNLYYDLLTDAKVRLFGEYINQIYKPFDEEKVISEHTPEELLDEAGYTLFKCHNEAEIQSFRKYYKEEEALCTFFGGRLNTDHVFFAVKKNVDEIKRENFKHPRREDEYGTSVISIQFSKDPYHILSIKNRYNHIVKNPDATFGNNLDNIIPGLTSSFAKYYGMTKSNKINLTMPNYRQINGRFYRYNEYLNDVYYCENNYIIDNDEVIKTYAKNPERYIVMDYYIIDLMDKTISLYDERLKDSFPSSIGKIDSFEIRKGDQTKFIIADSEDGTSYLTLNQNNQLIKADLLDIKEAGDNFMIHLDSLEELIAPRLTKVGNNFMQRAASLNEIRLPNLEKTGNNCLQDNVDLTVIELPALKEVGDNFISYNNIISYINLDALEKAGNNLLSNASYVTYGKFSKLKETGDNALRSLRFIRLLDMPELEKVGDNFIMSGAECKSIFLPNLKEAGNNFFADNQRAINAYLPQLEKAGDNFLRYNTLLHEVDFPNLKEAGNNFLASNSTITKAYLDYCTKIGANAFYHAVFLDELYMPRLKEKGPGFMKCKIHVDKGGKIR